MTTIGCTVIGILRAKPGKQDELKAILTGFVAPTRREEGCVDYHFHVSETDPTVFMFYENWRSRADLDLHLTLPHLDPIRRRGQELLATEVEIIPYTMLSSYDH